MLNCYIDQAVWLLPRQHALTSNSWDFASAGHNFSEDFTYDGMGNILTLKRNNQNGTLADNFKYHYYYQPQSGTGNSIFDPTGTKPGNVKAYTNKLANIDGSSTNNYQYDEIGNLKKDLSANIDAVNCTAYGKIAGIEKTDAAQNIAYSYDAAGNRVSKLYNNTSTYYVRDAQGNTLAVYTKNGSGATQWEEQHLYGSSRLGLWRPQPDQVHKGWVEGRKSYELSNHLGNVMAVINDNPSPAMGGGYTANVLSANDYYAFGSQMPGRSFNLGGSYRYGFNGKENDNDVGKGDGNQQDYGMRIYDPRLGRFLSVDPITAKYPMLTPYQFASNRPIDGVDEDGLEHSDYLKNFINNTITKLRSIAAEAIKKAAAKTAVSLVNYYVKNTEVKYYAKIEAKYTVGGRAALELEKSVGGDLNLGSVDLVSFTGEYDISKNKLDGTMNYLNKDGKTLFSRGISANVTIPVEGIPLGVGVGYSQEDEMIGKEKISTKKSSNIGAGIAPVNATVTIENQRNKETKENKGATNLAAGVGGAIGVGIVAEYKVEIGARIGKKEKE